MANRPPNTQLLINEEYISDLEETNEENSKMVERWKGYMKHVMDFLEILRAHFDDFDVVLEEFNEVNNGVDIVITPDEQIKFEINENQKS